MITTGTPPVITEPNRHLPPAKPSGGLNAKQLDSIRDSTALVNVWDGAVSSGKTIASMMRWLIFLSQTADLPGELVIVGRTRESAWRNVINPMMQVFPGTTKGNMGAPSCRILNQRVNILGASDSKAESVIRGITARGIYVDEMTTLPVAFVKMSLSRLRVTGRSGGLASRMFATTNPDNPRHWLKADYLDKIDTDPEIAATWRRFQFKLTDNTSLSPEYIRAMEAQYTGLFYRRFIQGEWVQGEGTIWDTWDDSRHVVDIVDLPIMERIVAAGVDFGSNHPSAGLLLGVAESKLWVLSEWAPMRTETGTLSPVVQSASLRRWLTEQPWGPVEHVFVDSAAKAFRDQLYTDGCPTAPAWKSVLPGIQLVHSLISADKLRVMNTCTGLLDEIPGYVWDAKAVARGEDAPVKEADDFCDALRYAIFSSRPQWQGLVPLIFPTAAQEAA